VSVEEGGQGGPLRFLTYNIRHGQGVGGLLSIRQTARAIAGAAPHAVAVNEAYRWPGLFDQPGRLGALLGLETVFQVNVRMGPTEYGNALLGDGARPFADVRLPSRLEARGLLIAEMTAAGAPVRVATTHLALDRRTRALQIAEIARVLPLDEPLVLMGDMNCVVEELGPLTEMLTLAGDPPPPTYPSLRPNRSLDYILFSEHWRLAATGTVRTLASDHLPLYADLVLR
jgi:endonuclease/exonuclease/phosphatase family metal-dependent hydrolase